MRSNNLFSKNYLKIYFLQDPVEKLILEQDVAKKQDGFLLLDTGLDYKLIIAPTPQLGSEQLGAFAAENIPANSTLGSCMGQNLFGVLDTEKMNKKIETLPENNFLWQKNFDNGTSIVIDLEKQGSALRFVNHSEAPNVEAVFNEATNSFDYITIKPISLGEEILVSYGENFFEDKKKINYYGSDLKSLLLSLGKSYNLSLDLSDPLTIKKIQEASFTIQYAQMEVDINFTAKEMEIISGIEINEKKLLDFNQMAEAYLVSNNDKRLDQNPIPNQSQEISVTQFSIFNAPTLSQESQRQIYLFVDKNHVIHPIEILDNNVLFINSQETVSIKSLFPNEKNPSKRRLLRHCLIYPETKKYVEANRNITMEDSGITTNQYGNVYRFWTTDHSGNRIEICKQLKTEFKPASKRSNEESKEILPLSKKAKTNEISKLPIDPSESIDQEKDNELYLFFEDNKLQSVKFIKIDRDKYYKITFDEDSGKLIEKELIKSRWDNRQAKCLINPNESEQKIKFVKPKEKKNITLKMPTQNVKQNQYSGEMKCWHVEKQIELVKYTTYVHHKAKNKDLNTESIHKKVTGKH